MTQEWDGPIKTEGLYINRHWRDVRYDEQSHAWSAGYHDKDGICYFTAEDFIQTHIFGFCGCGDAELTLKYIRDHMQLLQEHKANHFGPETGARYKFDAPEYLVWYELDRVGLTEHGHAVPGWLTKYGEEILHDLNTMYPVEDK